MANLRQITYASLISTNRRVRWWILAFAQVAGFFIVGQLSRLSWQFLPWLIAAVVFLLPITVWLWLDIEASGLKVARQTPIKNFLGYCLTSGVIVLFSLAVIVIVRSAYLHWAFLALLSSLITGTASLAMLYVVLCDQNLFFALALALDTWHKKISLAVAAAFVLIVAHGISFAFIHGVWDPLLADGHFSALNHSATIWILFALFALGIAYIAALLNCFLVFLFLEIIRRKKAPEAVEPATIKQHAFEGNH